MNSAKSSVAWSRAPPLSGPPGSSLRDRSELYQYWSRYLGDGPNRDVACEHRELADLTVARKTSSAADALERHIQRTTDFLIEYIRTHSLEER